MHYDVFISYSRKDYVDEKGKVIPNNPVSEIKKALKEANISYWIDEEGIYVGEAFAEKIVKSIQESDILVFISSENSNKSFYTPKEIAYAAQLGKYIVPILIDKSAFNQQILFWLSDINYLTYYLNPQKGLNDLVNSIKSQLLIIKNEKRQSFESKEHKKWATDPNIDNHTKNEPFSRQQRDELLTQTRICRDSQTQNDTTSTHYHQCGSSLSPLITTIKFDSNKTFDVKLHAFSKDSKSIIVTTEDTNIYLFDVFTGKKLRSIDESDTVITPQISCDGNLIAYGSSQHIVIRDFYTNKLIRRIDVGSSFEDYNKSSISFHPNNQFISTTGNGNIEIWDLHSAELQKTIKFGFFSSKPHQVKFSPKGNYLISSGFDKIWVHDYKTGQEFFSRKTISKTAAETIEMDNTEKLILSAEPEAIALYNIITNSTNVLYKTKEDGVRITSATFSPNNRFIAATHTVTEDVRIWDAQSLELIKRINFPVPVSNISNNVLFSPDGKLLAVLSFEEDIESIFIWDVEALMLKTQ